MVHAQDDIGKLSRNLGRGCHVLATQVQATDEALLPERGKTPLPGLA